MYNLPLVSLASEPVVGVVEVTNKARADRAGVVESPEVAQEVVANEAEDRLTLPTKVAEVVA